MVSGWFGGFLLLWLWYGFDLIIAVLRLYGGLAWRLVLWHWWLGDFTGFAAFFDLGCGWPMLIFHVW